LGHTDLGHCGGLVFYSGDGINFYINVGVS
jgi:hypothetical protein